MGSSSNRQRRAPARRASHHLQRVLALVSSLGLVACTQAALAVDAEHPARPDAETRPLPGEPEAYGADYDPARHLAPADPGAHHHHHGHPMPAPTPDPDNGPNGDAHEPSQGGPDEHDRHDGGQGDGAHDDGAHDDGAQDDEGAHDGHGGAHLQEGAHLHGGVS